MTDTTSTTPPSGATAPPQRELNLTWALVLISIAQLMVVLDATIANIALPYIQIDLEISNANLPWIVTGYALAFGSLLLLGGRLGDLYGRRKVFMVGLAIFAVASLLGGLATNEPLLLAARGLQGLGAALASPAALALITTTFPAGPARNRAFAVYAAMSGAGAAVGLILGGWLTGTSPEIFGIVVDGWRLTFLINVPIGLVAALARPALPQRVRVAPRRARPARRRHRHPGPARRRLRPDPGRLRGLGRHRSPSPAWSPASCMLVVFGLIESRVEHPLLPFRIFTNRTRASSFVAMFLAPAAMFAMFYFLSQYIQNVMGYSPLKAGVAFLPFTVGIVVGAGLASNLVNRIDPRYISGVGTLIAAGALFGFSRLPYDTSFPPSDVTGSYVTDIMPFIIMMAFGMGLTFVPVTLTAVHHLRSEESGIGSGVLNTAQQVGGALGLAVLATVATQTFTDRGKEFAAAAAGLPQPSPEQAKALRRDRAAADLHGGLDQRLPGRLDPDARRLGGDLDLPRRQARGARDRRPRGRRRPLIHRTTQRGRISGDGGPPSSHPITRPAPKETRERPAPDDVRRTRTAPGDGAGAARRQAALAPVGRRSQRLLATRRVAHPRDRAAGPRRGRRDLARCATGDAAGTAAPTRWPTPAGRSTGCAPSTATSRSSCSGTRWARASPSTPPTTRRWWASSVWRPGGRPTTRCTRSPAAR